MAKKMLIDATHPEETRVVVVDGNRVEEFDYETVTKAQISGNIYLAKVTRVEPSLQAAFVDYGGGRHGFLAFNEIHPDYYQIPVSDREALLEAEREAAQREAEEEDFDGARDDATESDDNGRRRGRRNGRGRGRGDRRNEKRPEPNAGGRAPHRNRRGLRPANDLAEAELPERLMSRLAEGVRPLPALALPEVDLDALAKSDQSASDSEPSDGPDFSDVESIEILETVVDENGETRVERRTLAAGGVMAEKTGVDLDAVISQDAPDSAEAEDEAQDGADDGAEDDAEDDASADQAGDDVEAADRSEASEADGDSDEDEDGDEAEAAADEGAEARGPEDAPQREGDAGGDARSEVEEVGAVDAREEIRPRRVRLRDYKIQEVVKRRQIMLVQVVKEERGTKGAALTTYLSLAGRYCVLMPNTARGGGISRKITNAADRKRLKAAAAELDVPEGMGLIIRTAGANRTKAEIKRDYEYLLRQWSSIRELTLKSIAPTLIYEEGSLIKRAIRDLYNKDIDAILVEGEEGYREAKDYMKMLMPSHARHVQYYREPTPLFIRYQVESQMSAMMQPVVQLKSGGYLVIGVTEALVAIDVNSGKSTKESSIEETALKTNLEAADEVARQMRLRDLAGLIVIDFIDMEESKNDRAVEKRLKDALKTDRARIQIGRISAFGLLEMSRQRLRPGLLEATTCVCPHCKGAGVIRSEESLALSVLRAIEEEALKGKSPALRAVAPVSVANYILNQKRARLMLIEDRHDLQVFIEGDPALVSPDFRVEKAKAIAREEPTRGAAVQMDAGLIAEDEELDIEDAEILEDAEDERREESRSESRDRSREDDRGDARGDARNAGKGRESRRPRADRSDSDADGDGESDAEARSEQRDDGDDRGDDRGGERKRRGRRGGRRRRRGGGGEDGDPMPVIDLDESGEDEAEPVAAEDARRGDDGRNGGRASRNEKAAAEKAGGADAEASSEAAEASTVAAAQEEPATALSADAGSSDAVEADTVSSDAVSADSGDAPADTAEETTDETAAAATTSSDASARPRLVEVEIAESAEQSEKADTASTSGKEAENNENSGKAKSAKEFESTARSEPEKPRRTGWWAFRRGA